MHNEDHKGENSSIPHSILAAFTVFIGCNNFKIVIIIVILSLHLVGASSIAAASNFFNFWLKYTYKGNRVKAL